MAQAIVFLLTSAITLMIWLVIVSAVLSWLVAFDVINLRNPTVYRITSALDQVTTPLLAPIRRFIPNLGGLDLSPIVFILLLQALLILIRTTLGPALYNVFGS